jgi:hypothetical protein
MKWQSESIDVPKGNWNWIFGSDCSGYFNQLLDVVWYSRVQSNGSCSYSCIVVVFVVVVDVVIVVVVVCCSRCCICCGCSCSVLR